MAKAQVRSVDIIAKKYEEVTPGRAAYYELGVSDPLEDWERNTVAAMAAYKGAVSAADIGKRFVGGAKRAGTGKWKRKSMDVGVDRYGPGVLAGVGDFSAGIEPFIAVIAATELSARKPRGDPANMKRVEQMATALHAKRLALIGAGVSLK